MEFENENVHEVFVILSKLAVFFLWKMPINIRSDQCYIARGDYYYRDY